MLFSVRMRAAAGGPHERGGRHISGAERLVPEDEVGTVAQAMFRRAQTHSRGTADFIRVTVEAVPETEICHVPLLALQERPATDVTAGRQAALAALTAAGVTPVAAQAGLAALASLPDSMRGAMVCCAVSGRRLDALAERGVRVTRHDSCDSAAFAAALARQGLQGEHVREALVLASKVAAAPGMVAELCWSDDPEYTTGYVASPRDGYIRLPHCKPLGSPVGGRVFFVSPAADLAAAIRFWQEQPVLVDLPATDWGCSRC